MTIRSFVRSFGIQILFAVLLGSSAFAIDPLNPRTCDLHLKGPVKQIIIEEIDHANKDRETQQTLTTTNVYTGDGRLVEARSSKDGVEYSVAKYAYDPAGHLAAVHSEHPTDAGPVFESHLKYDGQGRLIQVSDSTALWGWTFTYDNNGLKQRVEKYPVLNLEPNTAVGAVSWEGGYLSISRPSGGSMVTFYDEKDRPFRAEVRDTDQRVMMRLERAYDTDGRILSEKLTPENLDSVVPDELRGQMNDAQHAALAKFVARNMAQSEANYKYDAKGNLLEVRVSRGMLGDEAWAMQYNDNGDITSEVSVHLESPDFRKTFEVTDSGKMIPNKQHPIPPAAERSTRYERRNEYAYDAHGNWTEMKSWTRSTQSEEWIQSQTVKRIVTYY